MGQDRHVNHKNVYVLLIIAIMVMDKKIHQFISQLIYHAMFPE